MPLVGRSDGDRAVAHYNQAARYDKQNKLAKSRAHLRRALDYLDYFSFGMHHQPYDPKNPAYVEPYDPENHAYVPGKFEDNHAYLAAYKAVYDRELPTYYTMRDPPIHAGFVHPLVNVWVAEESGFVNVYRDIDTEADTYLAACGRVAAKHKPIMETIELPETFDVERADGTYSTCVAFNREFMHGFFLCFVVGGNNHGDRITVQTVMTERSEAAKAAKAAKAVYARPKRRECSRRVVSSLVEVEKRRRDDWTGNKMYALDVEGYRNSKGGAYVHAPLVNVWRLSDDSDTLTNIYMRDSLHLYTDAATTKKKSKTVGVESAYSFLSRVDTTRKQVPIANWVALDALRHQTVDHNHTTVAYMKWFLNLHVQTIRGKDTLVMPPFCVFFNHAFGLGRKNGRLVTIVNIAWCDGLADQVTLLGEWVNVNGVRMVRVFTTEGEFLDAYRLEIYRREDYENERAAEERDRKKAKALELKLKLEEESEYIGGTLVPTSEIRGKKDAKKPKKIEKRGL